MTSNLGSTEFDYGFEDPFNIYPKSIDTVVIQKHDKKVENVLKTVFACDGIEIFTLDHALEDGMSDKKNLK